MRHPRTIAAALLLWSVGVLGAGASEVARQAVLAIGFLACAALGALAIAAVGIDEILHEDKAAQ